MASEYGYITVAELETYTGIDYETTKATYTDAFVIERITMAERVVNSMCIQAPGATDGAIVATLILSERFMRLQMIIDALATEMKDSVKAFFDYLIEVVLKGDKYSPVSIIPMSGAER